MYCKSSLIVHFLMSGTMVMSCCSTMVTSQRASADESLIFQVRETEWQAAYRGGNDREKVLELVRPGESIKTWKDLLSINQIKRDEKNQGATVQQMADSFQQLLRENMGAVHWQVLESSPTSVTIWWRTAGNASQPQQHEVMRYLMGRENIYRIAYTTKSRSFTFHNVREWAEKLQQARVMGVSRP